MNETVRRLRTLVVVVWIGSLLASCAQSVGTAIEEPEKITLTFRHFWIRGHDTPVEQVISDVIQEFEHDHPQVKIDFEGMDQTIHREQKLKSEMVTGNPPDIIALFGGAEIEPYVNARRLVDLSDFLQERGIRERFKDLSLWTFDGGVYGLPLEGNAEPLFYNRELFERYDLEPPRTFDELIDVIHVFNDAGIIPFALGNEELWQGAIFYHYFLHRYGGSERIDAIAAGDGSFVNPEYIRASSEFERFLNTKPFPAKVNMLSREDAIRLFTTGQAAMYLNGNWDMTLFATGPEGAEFTRKIGVANFVPEGAAMGGSGGLAGGYTLGLGVSANLTESQTEAALMLLEYIYRPEVQTRLVYDAFRIPSMDVSADDWNEDSLFAQVTALLERTEETFIPYDNILPPEVNQQFLRSIRDMIEGKHEAGEELLEMQTVSDRYWTLRE